MMVVAVERVVVVAAAAVAVEEEEDRALKQNKAAVPANKLETAHSTDDLLVRAVHEVRSYASEVTQLWSAPSRISVLRLLL